MKVLLISTHNAPAYTTMRGHLIKAGHEVKRANELCLDFMKKADIAITFNDWTEDRTTICMVALCQDFGRLVVSHEHVYSNMVALLLSYKPTEEIPPWHQVFLNYFSNLEKKLNKRLAPFLTNPNKVNN